MDLIGYECPVPALCLFQVERHANFPHVDYRSQFPVLNLMPGFSISFFQVTTGYLEYSDLTFEFTLFVLDICGPASSYFLSSFFSILTI